MIAWNHYHSSAKYNLQERIAADSRTYKQRLNYESASVVEEGLFNDFTAALYLVQVAPMTTWRVIRVDDGQLADTDTGVHDREEARRFCEALVLVEGLRN